MKRNETSSTIFFGKIEFYSVGIRVSGATMAPPPPKRARAVARPVVSWAARAPPLVGLGSSIFYLFCNKSSKCFVQIWKLLFLHKNNTMVVLLKTASVRVSFIQIMEVRVQNKGKSVWKSRYVGDVSVRLKIPKVSDEAII